MSVIPSLPDLTGSRPVPTSNILSQTEKLSSNFPKIEKMTAGIEVITDKEEFNEVLEYLDELNITLEMLDEKNNYLQKISSENNSELKNGQDTTSAISTPINKNHIIILDKNQENYLNRLNNLSFYENTPEEFYHNLRKVFDVDNPEKRSGYILQQIEDDYYKLRISNHSVIVKNRTGAKTHQTSIVIKLTEDIRRTNEKARVIKYIYNPDKLTSEKMIGIISGIKDWIKTGDYTDKGYSKEYYSPREDLWKQLFSQKMTSAEYNNKEIDAFVTDKSGFVDPEKIAAIDLYGFEKAIIKAHPDVAVSSLSQHQNVDVAAISTVSELNKSVSDFVDKSILDYASSKIEKLTTNGLTYGFVHNFKIYLNPDKQNYKAKAYFYICTKILMMKKL